MRTVTADRGLALGHFLLAVSACLLVYFFPVAGLWPILVSLLPFCVRLFIDRPLFHDRWMDVLLAVFLVTAVIARWTAYDATAAGNKLDLLIAGILLYYAISTQPGTNLGALAAFWFALGVGVSLYFLLTLDFGIAPAKFHFINQLGLAWMSIRPAISWPAIQPTDTAAGIAILTSVYGLYFLVPSGEMSRYKLVRVLVLVGFGIVLVAVMLTTSRGAFVALASALGIWLVWMAIERISSPWKENISKFFPVGVLLFIGLTAILLILPLGIFGSGFFIGENLIVNRSELIRNGIAIMRDFPFLGGGLGSFPGLFSQYILVIPFYSLLNSHNLFVDVAIEQGMIGGLAFLLLYSISLWKITLLLRRKHTRRMQILYAAVFASLLIAMVHGLVDDYLYSGLWASLAFFPVGMSILAIGSEPANELASIRHTGSVQLSKKQGVWGKQVYSRGILLAVMGLTVAAIGLNWNRIASEWFANLGAVKMDKVELAEYPANNWDDGGRIRDLQSAKILFIRSLAYDANNQIANYRLGLINMSERDFSAASNYLAKAYQQEPSHRGVTKNLGDSYAWLGEMDKARLYLDKIPEAKSEMTVYVWWWDTQGRHDLSEKAADLASGLNSTGVQH